MRCHSTSGSGYTFPSCSYAPCRSDDSTARRNRTRTERQRRAAQLSSAQLAQLRSAPLRSAPLRSAQLSSAQLSSATLRSAQLSSAQLSSAQRCSGSARGSREYFGAAATIGPNVRHAAQGTKVVKGTTRYSASTRRISVGMSTICDSTNDCHSASVSCKPLRCCDQPTPCSAMAGCNPFSMLAAMSVAASQYGAAHCCSAHVSAIWFAAVPSRYAQSIHPMHARPDAVYEPTARSCAVRQAQRHRKDAQCAFQGRILRRRAPTPTNRLVMKTAAVKSISEALAREAVSTARAPFSREDEARSAGHERCRSTCRPLHAVCEYR
jgi:hypothetical protein